MESWSSSTLGSPSMYKRLSIQEEVTVDLVSSDCIPPLCNSIDIGIALIIISLNIEAPSG